VSQGSAENPLRILHLDLKRSWAGGQNQALLLARRLAERGHRQWITAPAESPLAERAAAAGLDVEPFDHRGEVNPLAIGSLWRLVRRLSPDVVHAHEAHGLTLAAVAARLPGPRPAVIGHRRVDFPIRGHAASRWKYARGADRLIAISEAVRDVLLEDGVPPERISLVPSGIDVEPASPPWPPLRERIGAPEGTPVILTIAQLADYKDHPTLVEAAARLRPRAPAARWVVAGGGPLLEPMRDEVVRHGLGDRVHYLGFVEGARGFLVEADVFALSSKTEGLGTSALDAMAAGVPVAATAAGGIPETVEDGVTGLLAPVGDPTALAATVDRLLDDPALARALAEAARERVRTDFDAAVTARRTERIYREALAKPRETMQTYCLA